MSRLILRAIDRFLPEDLVSEVLAQPHLGPALGAHAHRFDEAIPPDVRDRIEAVAYGEMLDLIRSLRAGGTATRTASFLATRSGY